MELAIAVLVLAVGGNASPLSVEIAGFEALERSPSREDRRCANLSGGWSVALAGGDLQVARRTPGYSVDPLPFDHESSKGRDGHRYVLQIEGGWLVGFDKGEFGGGLWWVSPDGKVWSHLRPPRDAPHHANDFYRADNVLGFVRVDGRPLVFMGLDHLNGRSGRAFELSLQDDEWTLGFAYVFDARPAAWAVDGNRVLVLTESGLWEAVLGDEARRLHEVNLHGVYPGSLVQTVDGAFYAGMRRYVLRLAESGDTWTETWFVPSGCRTARVVEYECRCIK